MLCSAVMSVSNISCAYPLVCRTLYSVFPNVFSASWTEPLSISASDVLCPWSMVMPFFHCAS